MSSILGGRFNAFTTLSVVEFPVSRKIADVPLVIFSRTVFLELAIDSIISNFFRYCPHRGDCSQAEERCKEDQAKQHSPGKLHPKWLSPPTVVIVAFLIFICPFRPGNNRCVEQL